MVGPDSWSIVSHKVDLLDSLWGAEWGDGATTGTIAHFLGPFSFPSLHGKRVAYTVACDGYMYATPSRLSSSQDSNPTKQCVSGSSGSGGGAEPVKRPRNGSCRAT